jgi:murein L,D-transpeptidase YafK
MAPVKPQAQLQVRTPTISNQSGHLKLDGMPRTKRSTIFLFALVLGILSINPAVSPLCKATEHADDVWVLIDTGALTLSVMQGEIPLRVFENIAIGSNGATWQKRTMDEKTPLGDFRISAVKHNSRFHLFLAIDYPTMEHARRALKDGRISPGEFQAVKQAWIRGETPPQNTGLGGLIGIHGVGEGDIEVHNRFNWTNGCVAITNQEIDELARLVGIGTRVTIR